VLPRVSCEHLFLPLAYLHACNRSQRLDWLASLPWHDTRAWSCSALLLTPTCMPYSALARVHTPCTPGLHWPASGHCMHLTAMILILPHMCRHALLRHLPALYSFMHVYHLRLEDSSSTAFLPGHFSLRSFLRISAASRSQCITPG
jgi:hypothetical protein